MKSISNSSSNDSKSKPKLFEFRYQKLPLNRISEIKLFGFVITFILRKATN